MFQYTFISFEVNVLDIWPAYLSDCHVLDISVLDHRILTKTTRSSSLKILPKGIIFIFHPVYDPGNKTAVFTNWRFKYCLLCHTHVPKRPMHVFKFLLNTPALLPAFTHFTAYFISVNNYFSWINVDIWFRYPWGSQGTIHMHAWKLFNQLATS